ncbi:collagen-like triple helix repeat-containing protein, partial [Bordetella bronchiseptica]
GIGAGLDPAISPVAGAVTNLTQMVGATTNLGAPVAGLLTSVGGTLAGAGG